MLSENFSEAAKDYAYLIRRGFNESNSRKLVGDHYALSGEERSALFRGIMKAEIAAKRRLRLLNEGNIQNQSLHVDALNVIYTLAAYLNGKLLFISGDSLLRDAAEYHGKRIRKDVLQQCTGLLFEYLTSKQPGRTDFFLDRPVHNSAVIQDILHEEINSSGIPGETATFDSADEVLRLMKTGIICSSDSGLIDQSTLPVFDLAAAVLNHHFKPQFPDFRNYL